MKDIKSQDSLPDPLHKKDEMALVEIDPKGSIDREEESSFLNFIKSFFVR